MLEMEYIFYSVYYIPTQLDVQIGNKGPYTWHTITEIFLTYTSSSRKEFIHYLKHGHKLHTEIKKTLESDLLH
jgi:hypothetical protein